MNKIPFKGPVYQDEAFNCPHCHAFANQRWSRSAFDGSYDLDVDRAHCTHCKKRSYWINEKMVYPDSGNFPSVNQDLNDEIVSDYLEAASIVAKSPRGAAALLRLCIQKLCKQLGESGNNINSDIASLVKKGLHPRVQQMLDYVRVIGNDAVHPGQIDLKDNAEIVVVLASLLNNIAEEMVSKPREIEKLYNSLPKEKLDGIKARDK